MQVAAEQIGATQMMAYQRRRRVCKVVLTLSILLLFQIFIPIPARGSGGGDGCNPGRADNYLHYYWAGMQQNAANNNVFGGVEASILSYSPFVYNVGADDSSEWVMLYDIDHGYTQLGWIEAIGGWRRTFIEYGNGGPFTDLYYSSTPINSLNDYKLVFDPTTWEYGYYLNGQGLRSIQLFYSPNQVQVYAEIHTSASQMPGGTANYNYADSARVYEPAGPNGHWSYASATTSNTAIFAHVLPQGGTSGVGQYDTYNNNCLY